MRAHPLRFVVLSLLAAVSLGACSDPPPPEPEIDANRFVPPPVEQGDATELPFVDVTASSGLASWKHETGAFELAPGKPSRWLPECMGPGLALFDADGDGDLDLYAANGTTFPGRPETSEATGRLYLQTEPMRFRDVTAEAGLAISMMGMGAAAADVDADGDQDLLVLTWGGPRLFRCESTSPTPRYVEVTAEAGLTTPNWTDANGNQGPDWAVSAVFLDADGDQDLDIYVANYVRWCPENDVFESLNGTDKSYAIPKRYEGHTGRLFRQVAPGRFEDATETMGFATTKAKSMAIALWDFNDDHRLDLVVSNDTQPNFLYLSQSDGTYAESALSANIAFDENGRTRAGMGIDAEEYALDGTVGIPIGNFSNEPVSLYREMSDGFFEDVGQIAGIAGASHLPLTFGLTWIDADVDGLLDLVIGNGHIEPEVQEVQASVSYAQRPRLFRQTAPGRFSDATDRAGPAFAIPMVVRGLARADLDGDGDEDLIVAENGRGLRLLRNDHFTTSSPAPAGTWLRFELEGRAPNRDAIGTTIDLTFENGQRRRLICRGGSSYASQSALLPTLGLKTTGRAIAATVRWPDGTTRELSAADLGGPVIRLKQ